MPNITLADIEHVIEAIGAFVLVATPIAHGAARLARKLVPLADLTETSADNMLAEEVAVGAEKVAAGLDKLAAILPRLTIGRIAAPAPKAEVQS